MINEKNKNIIIGVLIGIILILIIVIGLFLTGTISLHKNDTDADNTNFSNLENEILEASEYVVLEDSKINGDNVQVQTISFKNIDKSLTDEFVNEVENLIDSVARLSLNSDVPIENDMSSDIWYQVNGNVLSVHYSLTYEDVMGENISLLVTNIDLENKKVLANEEVINFAGSSFNEIAVDEYNEALSEIEKGVRYFDEAGNEISLAKFKENKDNYIKLMENGLEGAIYAYIEDGIVKYDSINDSVRTLYSTIPRGGFSGIETVEVGTYNK